MGIHEKFLNLLIDMPLALAAFPLIKVGYFAIPYTYFIMVVTFGLFCICYTFTSTSSMHKISLPYIEYPQIHPQVEQAQFDSDQIDYLSSHDMLTGLYNRVWLDRFLRDPAFPNNDNPAVIAAAGYSIVIIEINNLRMLNDNFGLETGNRCLSHLADLLRELTSCEHKLVRSSGDEFVIILPNSSPEQTRNFLFRLDQAINQSAAYPIHVSWGFASTNEINYSGNSALSLAKDRLVTSKLLDQNSAHSPSFKAILSIMRDRYRDTEEHMVRLQNLAIALARGISLPENQYPELRLLARLHDIGKIALNDSILLKNGPLDEEEWNQVRQHPVAGAQIVEMIPNLRHLGPSILSHHERWDGKGYPNQLKGEQIPILARIISLVDSWDAMTNDRSYRKALTFEQAYNEIEVNSGTQFDPVLSRKFLGILDQTKIECQKLAH